MKVEVTNPHEKKFEPITLAITIETREELLDMWARHLLSNSDMMECVRNDAGRWAANDASILAAVGSIPDDWDFVPLLVKLRPFVENLR